MSQTKVIRSNIWLKLQASHYVPRKRQVQDLERGTAKWSKVSSLR